MAYALSAAITIGKNVFRYAEQLSISSCWQDLGDTCTIRLPNLKGLLEEKIQTGMKVSVEIGYDGNHHKEFEGYVASVTPKIPFELFCEDGLYLLKRLSVNGGKGKAWKDTSMKRVLSEILKAVPHRLFEGIPDMALDQFRIDQGTTLAEALQKFKEDFSLCAYFRHGELFIGLPYTEIKKNKREDGTLAIYDLQRNVIDNQLIFQSKADTKLKVKAISLLKDNQKIEVEAGDQGGEERILYYRGETQKEKLKQMAQAELERLKFDGYQGSFEAFGLPYIIHSGVVDLSDERYPARRGRYLVKRVKTTWGIGGFRRRIEPGPGLKEPASALASQEPALNEISSENAQEFTPELDFEKLHIQERGEIKSREPNKHKKTESGKPNRREVTKSDRPKKKSRTKSDSLKDLESSSGSDDDKQKRLASGKRREHNDPTHVRARFLRFIRLGGILQRISEESGGVVGRNDIISVGPSTHQDISAKGGKQASHVIQAQLDEKIKERIGPDNYKELENELGHTQDKDPYMNNSRLGKAIDDIQKDIINEGKLSEINYRNGNLDDINNNNANSDDIENHKHNKQVVKEIRERFIAKLEKVLETEKNNPGAYQGMEGYLKETIETFKDQKLDEHALHNGWAYYKNKKDDAKRFEP